jgi:hypothetical protein
MPRVPLPERGQPLDLSYIYQLASTVNELSSQIAPATGRYTSIDTPSGPQSIRTSDARIVGGVVEVSNDSSVSSNNEGSFSYTFSDFKFVPVVTATPILTGVAGTEASKDIIVVLTRITTNRVEGIVRFGATGVAEIEVNIIAVGVPV